VEQRQPVGARHERVGEGQRRRLELERLGQLAAEEERALEPEVVERGPQGIAHHDNDGVAASNGGVAVMAFASPDRDDRGDPQPSMKEPPS
jgi:hypothetical protein